MAKPTINVEEEYYAENPDAATESMEAPPPADTDIAVTPEQMATMQQLAAAKDYAALGELVAGLITPAAAPTPIPMM